MKRFAAALFVSLCVASVTVQAKQGAQTLVSVTGLRVEGKDGVEKSFNLSVDTASMRRSLWQRGFKTTKDIAKAKLKRLEGALRRVHCSNPNTAGAFNPRFTTLRKIHRGVPEVLAKRLIAAARREAEPRPITVDVVKELISPRVQN